MNQDTNELNYSSWQEREMIQQFAFTQTRRQIFKMTGHVMRQ